MNTPPNDHFDDEFAPVPGVREEALRGWASCLLAHVARERLSGGIKPAEHEDIRETALRTLATIRGAR